MKPELKATVETTAPVEPKKAKAKSKKSKATSRPTTPEGSSVLLAEESLRRIESTLETIRGRCEQLVDEQRKKPLRWGYFGALATIEHHLRQALDGSQP